MAVATLAPARVAASVTDVPGGTVMAAPAFPPPDKEVVRVVGADVAQQQHVDANLFGGRAEKREQAVWTFVQPLLFFRNIKRGPERCSHLLGPVLDSSGPYKRKRTRLVFVLKHLAQHLLPRAHIAQ